MKVLIVPHADYYVMPAEELRAEYPDLTFVEPQTDAERLREVVDTDAFFGTPTSDEMRAAKRLRWIHNPGMGIDRLTTVPEIVASDVVITNAPGPHTNPMADHAFMFILALAHSLVETLDDQRQRVWDTVKYNGRMLPINGSRLGFSRWAASAEPSCSARWASACRSTPWTQAPPTSRPVSAPCTRPSGWTRCCGTRTGWS